jgi:hypothetical protein
MLYSELIKHVQGKTENIQRTKGNIQRKTGNIQRKTGNIQRKTGNIQTKTGDKCKARAGSRVFFNTWQIENQHSVGIFFRTLERFWVLP